MWEDRFFLAVSRKSSIFFYLIVLWVYRIEYYRMGMATWAAHEKKAAVFGRFFLLMHPFWWTNGKPGRREVEWTQKGTQMRH